MAHVKQENKCITLNGSAAMIREFLEYGISNILYQRRVYPPSDFQQSNYYDLNLFSLNSAYLIVTLGEIENFILKKEVRSVILVIKNSETRECLEKWTFAIDYEKDKLDDSLPNPLYGKKDPQTIRKEISAVLRQILGASTILPLLEENKMIFEIQAVPMPGIPQWPRWNTIAENQNIQDLQEFPLRAFSTSIHAVESKVIYKGV